MASKGAPIELMAPAGLGLLALIIPLIALYILKTQRSRRRVGSIWLWTAAQRDLRAQAPWRRLVLKLPLVLQALAIAALAVGLSRPATRGRGITGDHVAIVIDTSASMSAASRTRDGEETTRIELAKAAARDVLASLTPGSDALVLDAGRDAQLASPLDRDFLRVRAAIDRVAARDVEGDLGAALAIAVDRLRLLGGARRVVVITDNNLAHPIGGLAAASILPIEVITVGTPIDNVAIVRVDVRSVADPALGAEEVQAFLVLENFGRSPREVYVTMREDNASDVLASRRLALPPLERVPVPLAFNPSRGDHGKGLIFEIAPHDSMAVDDVAYAKVPDGDRLPVFLAGASPWLERALASDPMVDLRRGSVADIAGNNASIAPDTFVVVDGACPTTPVGGDLLIVRAPPGTCHGARVGATVEHPEITSWDDADLRMRFLTLADVHVARANVIEPESGARPLITTRLGAIAADISTADRAGSLVGFDVGDSDWPLKTSFVLFVRNVVEQARARRIRGLVGAVRAGDPIRMAVPRSATRMGATGPRGEAVEIAQRDGIAVIPNETRAGFYRITWEGPQTGTMSVPSNLTSAAESDLRSSALSAGPPAMAAISSAIPEAHTEWSWCLATLALAFIGLDVWFWSRIPRRVAADAEPQVLGARECERERR